MTRLRLLTVAFALALLLVVLLANLGALPPWIIRIYRFPGGDKVGHLLLMGGLSFLVNLSLQGRVTIFLGRRVPVGNLAVTTAGTVEELTQLGLRHRTFAPMDLLFDLVGIWILGCFAVWLTKRGRARSSLCTDEEDHGHSD